MYLGSVSERQRDNLRQRLSGSAAIVCDNWGVAIKMFKALKSSGFISNFGHKVRGYVANKAFNESFEVVLASTHELRQECFRLRYQIFCVERGFDLVNQNQMESDYYDKYSAHFLLKYRPANAYIGTGRLIFPQKENIFSLPLQKKLSQDVIHAYNLHNPDHVRRTCEISRIGILKSCSRSASKIFRNNDRWASKIMRKQIADIGKLGLYRAIFLLALRKDGITDCIFATDPFLLTKFTAVGFNSYCVMDDSLNIYGPVIAIKFNLHEMLENGRKQAPEGWVITTDNGRIFKHIKGELC